MGTPMSEEQDELGSAIRQGDTDRMVDAMDNIFNQWRLAQDNESEERRIAMAAPSVFEERADLLNRFTYHPPKEGQAERYETLRARGLELAMIINELTPPSRERSLAITKLEESIMWANAGIARN